MLCQQIAEHNYLLFKYANPRSHLVKKQRPRPGINTVLPIYLLHLEDGLRLKPLYKFIEYYSG